ncbi:MAG: DUF58 domain-containing protein [Nevskiaceae bacterium]|jgi:uncharacterized protein (DUF58 family)|nr:DUF58 domain-containing protein [Nevskiaceae bacterium]
MRTRFIPGAGLLIGVGFGFALILVALVSGASVQFAYRLALVWSVLLLAGAALDRYLTLQAWREASPQMLRILPAAFALGVPSRIRVEVHTGGERRWRVRLHDHADATLQVTGMPLPLQLHGQGALDFHYSVVPTRRGELRFEPADIRVRSRLNLLELCARVGESQTRRCYPDFAQIARYAWLAGDRRLAEIGIKTYQQRGEGTDFKQLAEYQIGDPLRHIDWKATLRYDKPIVRQFQDERDQCVILLLDCGRRMRADDREQGIGSSHFDQALNASMLLTYVALKQGDAVGAMTFGTPAGQQRWAPPRKGVQTLNGLMGELYAVQPTPAHSDYLTAAQDLMRRHHKRSLVILITNFRDEDADELGQALTLLRRRHLVLTASLRERIVNQLMWQQVDTFDSAVEVASANLYAQARREAFNRLAVRDSLMIDAEPQRLGIELVNRYQAVKKAGLI